MTDEIGPRSSTWGNAILTGILIIIWLAYIPFAFVLFALTVMGFDSGVTPLATRLFFLINGIPFGVLSICTGVFIFRKQWRKQVIGILFLGILLIYFRGWIIHGIGLLLS